MSGLPTQLTREIHISGISRLVEGVWVDSHIEVSERELVCLGILLDLMDSSGVPIALEYYHDTEKALRQLDSLRDFIRKNAELKPHGGDLLCSEKFL